MVCGSSCTDTLTDNSNCGNCGHACDVGTSCTNGGCGCPAGQMDCTGCTNVLTDNSNCGQCDMVCSGGKTCQTGNCACTGVTSDCSGVCVDKMTDNSNCGQCGMVCSGGKTCQTGNCRCTGTMVACSDGNCYDVTADRLHCGSGCSVCTSSQLCDSGCSTAPTLNIASPWDNPTGWTVNGGGPISMTFTLSPATSAPGITFQCRTYPISATPPAFANCDGSTGTTAVYRPAAMANGTYRTEVRYLQNGAQIGTTKTYDFYAHHNLDGAAHCAPTFTDAQYFAAAQAYATANPTLFSIPASPLFTGDASLKIANPFITIPFKQVSGSNSMLSHGWSGFPKDFAVKDLSLRHRWTLDAANKLLLMKRNYVSPAGGCRNISQMNHAGTFDFAQCEAFVMNIKGVGLCMGNTGGVAAVKGTPYVAGWWRMRTVRYPSFMNSGITSSAYCGAASCSTAPNLIYLPP
jgi:hypothetical protein